MQKWAEMTEQNGRLWCTLWHRKFKPSCSSGWCQSPLLMRSGQEQWKPASITDNPQLNLHRLLLDWTIKPTSQYEHCSTLAKTFSNSMIQCALQYRVDLLNYMYLYTEQSALKISCIQCLPYTVDACTYSFQLRCAWIYLKFMSDSRHSEI